MKLCIEVDNAVEVGGHDPTGGRSINGEMDSKFSDKEQEEVLRSDI
jgi:hypothetical protein